MHRAGGCENGPVGAIYQANVAGGKFGKGVQEGEVTRIEVGMDKLHLTGHVWIVSPVGKGWKFESHDIMAYKVGRLWRAGGYEERKEKGFEGANAGSKF